MNVAAPPLDANPGSDVAGAIAFVIFLLLGLFLTIFPGKFAAFQIWMLERQLRGARKPGRVMMYRLMGIVFIMGSVVSLVLLLTQAPVSRS